MSYSEYSNYLVQLLEKRNFAIDIDIVVREILSGILRGNSIWIMGNGGSASTAEHFETDLSFVKAGKSVPSIKVSALTSNSSLITAISNDLGFEYVFSHQLRRKANSGDICILISASGNSLNLLKAIDEARKLNLITLGILGFDGGKLAKLVTHSIIVETEIGEYGPVEDLHLSICHEISALIGKKLSSMNL